MVYSEDEDMAWLGNIIRYISRNRNLSYDDFYEFLQTQEEGAGEPETNEKAGWETKIVDGISQTSEIPAEAPETEAASGTEPEVKSRGLENHEEEDELEDLKSVLESIPAAESVSALKADTSEMELSSVVEEVSETEMGERIRRKLNRKQRHQKKRMSSWRISRVLLWKVCLCDVQNMRLIR